MTKSFIVALAILTLAACSDGRSDHRQNKILRYDIPAPAGSLNPLETLSSGAVYIFPFLFSYLCVPDEKGILKPDLAVNWSYDPSEPAWTIKLRNDARFHDGTPVTAKDVKFSIQHFLNGVRDYLGNSIKKIDIISSTCISIKLNKSDPDFINKIWDCDIVPEHLAESNDFSDHPVGSGPFKFKARQGDRIVELVANDDYYAGKSQLEGVAFFYQGDREKNWDRLMAGDTDIACEISRKDYRIMAYLKDHFYFDAYTLPRYSILLYNTKDPLFSDVRVRRALTHAINRPYIVEKLLNGYGKAAVGPMGIDNAFSNPDLTPLPYDPQKSLELLRLAGWSLDENLRYLQKDGKIFEFTIFAFKEGYIPIQVARYIVLNLNQLGIHAHVDMLSQKELNRRYYRSNQFQAVLTEFGTSQRIPEAIEDLWAPSFNDFSVAGGFEDEEVTRLFRLMDSENGPEKRKALCHQIDARIAFLQPGTFLYHETAIDVMSARISIPFPFSLTADGASRLWRATIQ